MSDTDEVENRERLDIIIALTDAYQATEKYHEPNLTDEQLYEKCRQDAIDDMDSYIYHRDKRRFKAFFDAFEAEIDQQEFAIDESECRSITGFQGSRANRNEVTSLAQAKD